MSLFTAYRTSCIYSGRRQRRSFHTRDPVVGAQQIMTATIVGGKIAIAHRSYHRGSDV